MAELNFREATTDDIPEILSLDQECFARPWSEALFTHEILSPTSMVFIARDKESFVGFISMMMVYDEAHITNVAVSIPYRRRRIAYSLLQIAESAAAACGMLRLTLEVRVGNSAARALYEKFGYTAVGIRPHYYDDNGEDAVIMDKVI